MSAFLATRGMGGVTVAAAGMGYGVSSGPEPEPDPEDTDTEQLITSRTIRARIARDGEACSGTRQ